MNDIYQGLASLTPEQRALFEVLLEKEGVDLAQLPILKRSTTESPPLSFSQERFLYLQQSVPETPAFNFQRSIRMKGPLNVAALERSLSELLRRHEVLRTICSMEDDRPVQKILPPEAVRLPVTDLQNIPEGKREQEALVLAQEHACRPFDLCVGPLVRTVLLRLAADEHVLIWVMHIFVIDGYSEGILAQELGTLYQAFSTGQSSPLPELPVQYGDYACWERQRLQREILREQLDYWTRRLFGAPALLELPTDRPRPKLMTYRGATERFELEEKLSDELRTLSGRLGVTLFVTLLSAYQLLLHRYSRQHDIIVSTTVSNRNRSELAGLIGSFANTVIIRSDFSQDLTFGELVGTVAETTLEAFSNQDLPFDQLVRELRPKRDPSYTPIFQAAFELHQDTLENSLMFPGLTVSTLEIEKGTARFDLDMAMVNGKAQGLVGMLEYNSELFDKETIKRLLGHFRVLLEGIVADPKARISDLPWLAHEERWQILENWNDTAIPFPKEACIHNLIEAQVDRNSEALAVRAGDYELSYDELERRANQLAQHLCTLGIGPEVLVGVCLERSVDMVIALLGIFKAGGAYVPLDPDYPRERLGFMLKDAGIPVLLTQSKLLDRLPEHAAQVVCLDNDWHMITGYRVDRPVTQITSENLCYVIYTSGSTGTPKGVQVSHRAAVNFLTSMAREPGLTAKDTLLSVTTLSFDIAVLEIFLPLCVGACVVLIDHQVAWDGAELCKQLSISSATVMQATPATWRLLIEAGWRGSEGFRALCGGEALSRDLASALTMRAGSVWNMYGPTETTVWSTCYHLSKHPVGPILIGRPIANTRVYILDRHLQPVPVGVPGEIYIGGLGMSRGYLNRPELTEERFVPDPFCEDPKARLYRTGDLVRYRPDGNLDYLGRLDQQIKVRGFRIELGEVEAVLAKHPAVDQAVVVVGEDQPEDKRLVAYFVPRVGQRVTVTELRKYLRTWLPEYMVPQHVVELDALPVMPNGKMDRRALPRPFSVGATEDTYVAPRTEMEACVAGIWREVLGVERVGVRDNFFELGGHSLLTIRMATRIEAATGVRPQLRSLVLDTLEQIASVCEREALGAEHEPVQNSPLSQGSWKRLVGKVLGLSGQSSSSS